MIIKKFFKKIGRGIKKIVRGVGKVFKKIGKGIGKVGKAIFKGVKKTFKGVSKFLGKLGPFGSIALTFLLPGIGGMLGNWAGGMMASSNSIISGMGHVLNAGVNIASKVGNVVGSVAEGVGKVVGRVVGATLNKIPGMDKLVSRVSSALGKNIDISNMTFTGKEGIMETARAAFDDIVASGSDLFSKGTLTDLNKYAQETRNKVLMSESIETSIDESNFRRSEAIIKSEESLNLKITEGTVTPEDFQKHMDLMSDPLAGRKMSLVDPNDLVDPTDLLQRNPDGTILLDDLGQPQLKLIKPDMSVEGQIKSSFESMQESLLAPPVSVEVPELKLTTDTLKEPSSFNIDVQPEGANLVNEGYKLEDIYETDQFGMPTTDPTTGEFVKKAPPRFNIDAQTEGINLVDESLGQPVVDEVTASRAFEFNPETPNFTAARDVGIEEIADGVFEETKFSYGQAGISAGISMGQQYADALKNYKKSVEGQGGAGSYMGDISIPFVKIDPAESNQSTIAEVFQGMSVDNLGYDPIHIPKSTWSRGISERLSYLR